MEIEKDMQDAFEFQFQRFFLQMENQFDALPESRRTNRRDFVPIFLVNMLLNVLQKHESDKNSDTRSILASITTSRLGIDATKHSGSRTDMELENGNGFLISTKTLRKYVKQLLIFANLIRDTSGIGLDDMKLVTLFCSKIRHPSLELVWLMSCSKYKVFGFITYIIRLQSDSEKQFLSKQIIEFIFSSHTWEEATKRKCSKMLSDILPEIIVFAHANSSPKQQLISVKSLATDILAEINLRSMSESSFRISRELIVAIMEGAPLPNSLKKKYRLAQLDQILSHSSALAIQDVHRQQETFAEQLELQHSGVWEHISSILSQSSEMMLQKAFQMSSAHIDEGRMNWVALLHVISVIVDANEEQQTNVFSLVRELIRDLFASGLTENDSYKVLGAFILARHCCLISPEKFDRYEKWYVGTFGNAVTSPANTPDKFTVLTSVLSELVPNEPVCFLQVHTTYNVYVPTGMRPIWNDYIKLAKDRNAEFNEIEEAMGYEPNPNNPVQRDIERVLRAFDSKKKIPEAISEMLLFRKQYYYEQFLPSLLRKPFGAPISDGKCRLIEALNLGGKIPPELYAAYKRN